MSEKDVMREVREYPIVVRDSLEHEFMPFLLFKNRKDEVKLSCYFFAGQCHLVNHFTPLSSFASAVRYADEDYKRAGDHKWISKDSTFTVIIRKSADEVITSYSRGVTKF